ncbi:MAG TPA: sigma factor-like helix-turn-helix DNA-binding protein [Niabella sp.]|mgnify:CR=1 FL=1|nr:sigma factor-like helix-turn-helix DNA-binding protein [Niabella sp.]
MIPGDNKQRQAFWQQMMQQYTAAEVEKALHTLPVEVEKVLRLYYFNAMSFSDIADKMDRSISVIYNHHNRGIYKLWQYFNQSPRS